MWRLNYLYSNGHIMNIYAYFLSQNGKFKNCMQAHMSKISLMQKHSHLQ